MGCDTLNKPVAFGLQDYAFVIRSLVVEVRSPELALYVLFHLGRVLGDFVRGFFVSHYAAKHRVDILLVEPIDKLGTLNPIRFLSGKLSWPHTWERNINTNKFG